MQQALKQSCGQKKEEQKQPINKWTLVCSGEHEIKLTCVQAKCNRTALHCVHPQCTNCFGLHPYCKTIPISNFSDFLSLNYANQLNLLELTSKIEQEMIKKIQESQQQLMNQLQFTGLPKSISSIFKDIFLNKNFKHLTGMDFDSLQDEISNFRPLNKEKVLIDHSMKAQAALQAYLFQKKEIITSFQANQRLISKILTSQEDKNFIFDSLGQPKKLQLLYRGSQNHFSAAKFHEKCDEIEHTLTIVRTEFEKIIAAYTPLKWSSPSAWTAFCDNSNRSFLLQVNLKQKMALTEPLYAIYCNQMHGPRFGRSDLTIVNKCNQNNCTGNFPASYNQVGKFVNGQQSYTAFSGTPSGFYFRVVEYEVFRVIF